MGTSMLGWDHCVLFQSIQSSVKDKMNVTDSNKRMKIVKAEATMAMIVKSSGQENIGWKPIDMKN